MNDALFNRLRTYIEAVAVARRLLKAGLISQDEFLFIEEQTALLYAGDHDDGGETD